MELNQIKNILHNFKNLGISNLSNEENICIEKTNKIAEEIEEKLETIRILDEYIEELNEDISLIKEDLEVLDVETIRTKTQKKKTEKDIVKLESLNTSRLKIDASENDKHRMRINLSKLMLTKKFTGLDMNKEGKGIITDNDGKIKPIQLNKNNTKETNSEIVWKEISQCSKYNNEWKMLFQNE